MTYITTKQEIETERLN